jgi:hypothetical protein
VTSLGNGAQTPKKESPQFQRMLEEALNRGNVSAFAGGCKREGFRL